MVVLALTASALTPLVALLGLATAFAYLAPALLLLLPLLGGRYIGAERLERMARRRARRPARRRSLRIPAPRRAARVLVPRGARLIAFSLAVRPPPAAATA